MVSSDTKNQVFGVNYKQFKEIQLWGQFSTHYKPGLKTQFR